ncbi:hypothetical protein GW916_01365 [bacterium]|nr:hypothetical protein [bacterium]
MNKFKIMCFFCCLFVGVSAFGADSSLRANKSIFCDDKQDDGADMVSGLHNPFRMRGYIFADLPIDNIVGAVLDNHVRPHMVSVCEDDSKDFADYMIIDLLNVCSKGCSVEAGGFFKFRRSKREALTKACRANCSSSWSEMIYYINGYEKALQAR